MSLSVRAKPYRRTVWVCSQLGSFCVEQRSLLEPDFSMALTASCATPEAASQRGPPVSSCPLILMAGHLERREICLPAVFLACACQCKQRSPQGWGHTRASGPCSTDLSRGKQGLCLAWLLQLSGAVVLLHRRGSTREISQASS